jgi:hypothetical protein
MRMQWAVGSEQWAEGGSRKHWAEEKPSVRNMELKAFFCPLPTSYCPIGGSATVAGCVALTWMVLLSESK